MTTTPTAGEVLDRHYLEVRSLLLEVAATLDRIDRARGSVGEDPRHEQLTAAAQLLLQESPGRAERLQRLFSRPYSPQWRQEMGI